MQVSTDLSAERCPLCGKGNPLELVYGIPSGEMLKAVDAGHIALGGYLITDSNPAYRCRDGNCAREWGVIDWNE